MSNTRAMALCDNLLGTYSDETSMRVAAAVREAIVKIGALPRADMVMGLIFVMLAALDEKDLAAQSEATVELIRRAVRKELGKREPS